MHNFNILSRRAFLDRSFGEKRCREMAFDVADFWQQSASTPEALAKWLEKEKDNIAGETSEIATHGTWVAKDIIYTFKDGKRVRKRLLTGGAALA